MPQICRGGTGTEAGPYLIANGEQLALLAQYVNSNNADYVSAYYTLTADILLNDDINSEPNRWTSIGIRDDGMSAVAERPFRGTFDGANHKVIGLYQTGDYAYGLFSCISDSAVVKNLNVTDGKIEPRKIGVGAICGLNEGKMINCTNEADIAIQREESVQIGGICGINSGGNIENIITGQLYVADKATGDSFTYSVKTYADYILENSAEYPDEIPLVNAMLNYGAAAEKYFRGSTALNFTKPDVDASVLSQYRFAVNDNDSSIDYMGQVISLKNKVTAKLYFSGKELSTGDFTVTQNGEAVESSRLSVGSDANGTYLAISGISANEMSAPFEISVGGVTTSKWCLSAALRKRVQSRAENGSVRLIPSGLLCNKGGDYDNGTSSHINEML